ncbi:hypothetical protein CCP2SC5_160057 [Azospirillaceae bacterium]
MIIKPRTKRANQRLCKGRWDQSPRTPHTRDTLGTRPSTCSLFIFNHPRLTDSKLPTYPSIREKSATAFKIVRICANKYKRFTRNSALSAFTVTRSKKASNGRRNWAKAAIHPAKFSAANNGVASAATMLNATPNAVSSG